MHLKKTNRTNYRKMEAPYFQIIPPWDFTLPVEPFGLSGRQCQACNLGVKGANWEQDQSRSQPKNIFLALKAFTIPLQLLEVQTWTGRGGLSSFFTSCNQFHLIPIPQCIIPYSKNVARHCRLTQLATAENAELKRSLMVNGIILPVFTKCTWSHKLIIPVNISN